MWADILTKPLQERAFGTMQAELMNCPMNYKEPHEEKVGERMKETSRWKMGRSMSTSPKTVTWKSVVATPFKTPQECVGHSGARIRKIQTDKHGARIHKIPMDRGLGRATYSQGPVRLGN